MGGGIGSPAPFLQCDKLILLLVVLECLLILPGLMRNSERPGFATFAALGPEEFDQEVDGWLPLLPVISSWIDWCTAC